MHYNTAYLWEKGKEAQYNAVSLILQQINIRKQSVLFVCVCQGQNNKECGVLESGYFTEALVEWFHRDCLKLLEKKWTEAEVDRSIRGEVARVLKELGQYAQKKGFQNALQFAGMVFIEHRFWSFTMGNIPVFLINRRLGRKNMRQILKGNDKQGVEWETGSIQKKLGLLLCTADFLQTIEMDIAAEALLADGEKKEERMQKCLQELWRTGGQRDKDACAGAVYIRV